MNEDTEPGASAPRRRKFLRAIPAVLSALAACAAIAALFWGIGLGEKSAEKAERPFYLSLRDAGYDVPYGNIRNDPSEDRHTAYFDLERCKVHMAEVRKSPTISGFKVIGVECRKFAFSDEYLDPALLALTSVEDVDRDDLANAIIATQNRIRVKPER